MLDQGDSHSLTDLAAAGSAKTNHAVHKRCRSFSSLSNVEPPKTRAVGHGRPMLPFPSCCGSAVKVCANLPCGAVPPRPSATSHCHSALPFPFPFGVARKLQTDPSAPVIPSVPPKDSGSGAALAAPLAAGHHATACAQRAFGMGGLDASCLASAKAGARHCSPPLPSC